MSDQKRRGKLFVLAGPSGVGKGTLRAKLLGDIDNLVYSVSCTTRPRRSDEREGVEYRFVSDEEFEEGIKHGLFLEYARVHNYCYGTMREDVGRELDAGRDVLLEIDVQGARQVREYCPESVTIFISPPSFEALEERLRHRNTESEEQIVLRLKNAREEMRQIPEYTHVVLNNELDRAGEELKNIILSYRRQDADMPQGCDISQKRADAGGKI